MRYRRAPGDPLGITHAPDVPFGAGQGRRVLGVIARLGAILQTADQRLSISASAALTAIRATGRRRSLR